MVALMIIDKSIVELLVITQKVHKRRLLLCTVDCCQHQISSSECVATPQQNNNSKDRVDISSPVISGIFRYTSNSFVVSSLRTRLSQRREREIENVLVICHSLVSEKSYYFLFQYSIIMSTECVDAMAHIYSSRYTQKSVTNCGRHAAYQEQRLNYLSHWWLTTARMWWMHMSAVHHWVQVFANKMHKSIRNLNGCCTMYILI